MRTGVNSIQQSWFNLYIDIRNKSYQIHFRLQLLSQHGFYLQHELYGLATDVPCVAVRLRRNRVENGVWTQLHRGFEIETLQGQIMMIYTMELEKAMRPESFALSFRICMISLASIKRLT